MMDFIMLVRNVSENIARGHNFEHAKTNGTEIDGEWIKNIRIGKIAAVENGIKGRKSERRRMPNGVNDMQMTPFFAFGRQVGRRTHG
jgi:hypothetical protein